MRKIVLSALVCLCFLAGESARAQENAGLYKVVADSLMRHWTICLSVGHLDTSNYDETWSIIERDLFTFYEGVQREYQMIAFRKRVRDGSEYMRASYLERPDLETFCSRLHDYNLEFFKLDRQKMGLE